MPLWIISPDKIEIGERVKDRSGPPMWVAEVVRRVPISTLIRNTNAKKWNAVYPDEQPLELEPEIEQWCMRLVGAQLRLCDS